VPGRETWPNWFYVRLVFLPQNFDLCTVTEDDLNFTVDFKLDPIAPSTSPTGDGAPEPVPTTEGPVGCYGIALWFDRFVLGAILQDNPSGVNHVSIQ